MRYAIVTHDGRTVDNVCEWTGDAWTPPVGTIVIPVSANDPVQCGDLFDIETGAFSRPVIIDAPVEAPAGDAPLPDSP